MSREEFERIFHNIVTNEFLQWNLGRFPMELAVSNMLRVIMLEVVKPKLTQAIYQAQEEYEQRGRND